MECPYDIYCGLDVGKFSHYAVANRVGGEKLADGEFPQDEVKLQELFSRLADQGRVLVVVDQPNTIGALPVAVAQNLGVDVAYLPGLAMRRAADLYPGNAKTDARDAFIIADTARSMPHTLRAIDKESEVLVSSQSTRWL
jgi:transposase